MCVYGRGQLWCTERGMYTKGVECACTGRRCVYTEGVDCACSRRGCVYMEGVKCACSRRKWVYTEGVKCVCIGRRCVYSGTPVRLMDTPQQLVDTHDTSNGQLWKSRPSFRSLQYLRWQRTLYFQGRQTCTVKSWALSDTLQVAVHFVGVLPLHS